MPTAKKPLSESGKDNRRATRKRTLFSGKISYSNGAHSVDCSIRNVSQTGARISLTKGVGLPSQLYLIDLRHGIAYEAKVEWSRTPDFGLTFLKTYPLAALSDPSLDYLKQLWIACAGH
jgi:hypothetical protein